MRRNNAQLLRNDAAWHLFWCAFGLAAFGKWAALAQVPPLGEALAMSLYTAWSPLILFLARHK